MIENQYVNLVRGYNWPPVTSITLEPTPLSEIGLLRTQGYFRPCTKLQDTCYNLVLDVTLKRAELSYFNDIISLSFC
jgi:hypothetical protein